MYHQIWAIHPEKAAVKNSEQSFIFLSKSHIFPDVSKKEDGENWVWKKYKTINWFLANSVFITVEFISLQQFY